MDTTAGEFGVRPTIHGKVLKLLVNILGTLADYINRDLGLAIYAYKGGMGALEVWVDLFLVMLRTKNIT